MNRRPFYVSLNRHQPRSLQLAPSGLDRRPRPRLRRLHAGRFLVRLAVERVGWMVLTFIFAAVVTWQALKHVDPADLDQTKHPSHLGPGKKSW